MVLRQNYWKAKNLKAELELDIAYRELSEKNRQKRKNIVKKLNSIISFD